MKKKNMLEEKNNLEKNYKLLVEKEKKKKI